MSKDSVNLNPVKAFDKVNQGNVSLDNTKKTDTKKTDGSIFFNGNYYNENELPYEDDAVYDVYKDSKVKDTAKDTTEITEAYEDDATYSNYAKGNVADAKVKKNQVKIAHENFYHILALEKGASQIPDKAFTIYEDGGAVIDLSKVDKKFHEGILKYQMPDTK